VIKFVSDLQQADGFLWVLVISTNTTDRHDIGELLLKVALSTITLTITHNKHRHVCQQNIAHID